MISTPAIQREARPLRRARRPHCGRPTRWQACRCIHEEYHPEEGQHGRRLRNINRTISRGPSRVWHEALEIDRLLHPQSDYLIFIRAICSYAPYPSQTLRLPLRSAHYCHDAAVVRVTAPLPTCNSIPGSQAPLRPTSRSYWARGPPRKKNASALVMMMRSYRQIACSCTSRRRSAM